MPELPTFIIELGGEFIAKPRWEYIKGEARVWRRFVWGYMSISKDITPPNFEIGETVL